MKRWIIIAAGAAVFGWAGGCNCDKGAPERPWSPPSSELMDSIEGQWYPTMYDLYNFGDWENMKHFCLAKPFRVVIDDGDVSIKGPKGEFTCDKYEVSAGLSTLKADCMGHELRLGILGRADNKLYVQKKLPGWIGLQEPFVKMPGFAEKVDAILKEHDVDCARVLKDMKAGRPIISPRAAEKQPPAPQ